MKLSAADIDVTARTVYGEARGEPRLGRIAVAWVIRNRSIEKNRPPAETAMKKWQFSAWNENDPNLDKIKRITLDNQVFQECMLAALSVLLGQEPDPTGGATHYYASSIEPPFWTEAPARKTVIIGRHIFYNDVAYS